jgi:hypothetical protein
MHWNKSRRSDHPLADRRHVDEFLARLRRQDAFTVLEESAFWLKASRDAYGLTPARRFEIADTLDLTTRAALGKVASDFVSLGSRYHTFQAQRTWNLCFQFSRELGATYQYLVDQYRQRVAGYEMLLPMLPLMISRSLRALRAELNWSLLRHGPVDQLLWSLAGSLYSYAEEGKFAANSVTVYPQLPRRSSPRREYLQTLMMGISATDALLPEDQHLIAFLIEGYGDLFGLERTPRRGCHYVTDLAGSFAPARLVERPAASPSIRYFGPDRASEEVDRLIEAIRERGMIPPELNAGGKRSAAAVLDVLDHVVRYWAPTPPIRASARTPSAIRISVVHGFSAILDMVSGDSQELDFNSNVETWMVQNESEGGFGAVITETASDWIEVGSLLAIGIEESASWAVGLVRRLSRPMANTIHVGIEILSRGAVKVATESVGASHPLREFDALLLLSSTAGSGPKGEVQMVLPRTSFAEDRAFTMRTHEVRYSLTPIRLCHMGDDYELVQFQACRAGPPFQVNNAS